MQILFDFNHYWQFYGAFLGLVLLLLAVDLGIFHRNPHTVGIKEALGWSVVWIIIALLFNAALYFYTFNKVASNPELIARFGEPGAMASRIALEFLTGYLVEKSLSVDNIFVFVVILNFFAIPPKLQHRVLFYGILGALILRGIFVAVGAALFQYEWVIIVFGVFLAGTGIKMFFTHDKPIEPERNWAIRALRRIIPIKSDPTVPSFFVRENGKTFGTPLLVALVFAEITDLIFAVDSVPAIFAITREPFIVFTSNVFAILGLRSLYFVLAGVMDKFHLLHYGLGVVLVFIGLKMSWLDHAWEGKFPIPFSLGIIGSTIAAAVILSLLIPKRTPQVDSAG